jgi:hypothetical protein
MSPKNAKLELASKSDEARKFLRIELRVRSNAEGGSGNGFAGIKGHYVRELVKHPVEDPG